jgi:uncharacterized membrane protein YbhN (UPF0104 family)
MLQRLRKLLANPRIKSGLIVAVLLVTVLLFVHFFVDHPEYIRQLRHLSPWVIVQILALNAVMIVVLTLICAVTLAICGKRMSWKENFLLTSYSSIANFFGPLQSGPGVRAAYLKTRHQVRLRDYTLVSLLALGLFACFSALFLFVGTRPWWQTVSALLVVAGFSAFVVRLFKGRDKHPDESRLVFSSNLIIALIVLTFLQVCVTAAWYYAELHAVDPHVHFSQALSYAGAANFSLFVSITPDAIGIREAFLVFSQHIHHVSTHDIASANLIDRAAYVLFLGMLFVVVLALHAKDRLHIKGLKRVVSEVER